MKRGFRSLFAAILFIVVILFSAEECGDGIDIDGIVLSNIAGDLEVFVPFDCYINIYEIASGVVVLQNYQLAQNSSHIIPFQHSNKYYLIQFLVDDYVVHQKSYFIDQYSLLLGIAE